MTKPTEIDALNALAESANPHGSATTDARVAALEAENARLRHFAGFALKWTDRGPPHGGPGNEAQCLDAIRHHPVLSAMRREAAKG